MMSTDESTIHGQLITIKYINGKISSYWFGESEPYHLFLSLCEGEVLSVSDCTLREYRVRMNPDKQWITDTLNNRN